MTDRIIDQVASLACARRALTIARDGEARFRGISHHGNFDYSEVLHGLIRQVQFCEAKLVASIEAEGGLVESAGEILTVGVNDRRRYVRPSFEVHRMGPRDVERRRS
jgi:hypothetical protein